MKPENEPSRIIERFRPDSIELRDRFDIAKSEALFGWSEISDLISSNLNCLEIGAGSGLLATLAANQSANIVALEPIAAGFSETDAILQAVERLQNAALRVHRDSIEDFQTDERFDLIWSVNVFEHLPDWRAALNKSYGLLKPGGVCLILCPNYSVPYEPHFSLPIFASKGLTRRLFRKRIERHEAKKNSTGLWESLNLITARQVRQHCRAEGIEVTFDKTIMPRMIERFANSEGINRRHQAIGPIVKLASQLGLTRVIGQFPIAVQPYMAIKIVKP